MLSDYRYTVAGKEVNSVSGKILILCLLGIALLIGIGISPVLVPLHFLLRKIGRNGFYFDHRLVFTSESFAYQGSDPSEATIKITIATPLGGPK